MTDNCEFPRQMIVLTGVRTPTGLYENARWQDHPPAHSDGTCAIVAAPMVNGGGTPADPVGKDLDDAWFTSPHCFIVEDVRKVSAETLNRVRQILVRSGMDANAATKAAGNLAGDFVLVPRSMTGQ